jgi:polyhydroxybutyrate depolymerase
MTKGLFLSFLLLGAPLAALDLAQGGLTRHYLLSRPDGSGPWPLVIALHGHGGTAENMERLTGLMQYGKAQGFAVAYPDGIGKAWDDGRSDLSGGSQADDVGFLTALRADLVAEKVANPNRVYLCGISNGGMMTLRMACEHAELFAAVGVVAMSMSAAYDCRPSQPLPICFINGDQDPLVPYLGGKVGFLKRLRNRGRVISVADSIQFWVTQNHASPDPLDEMLPDLDPKDGTRVELKRYNALENGAAVYAYKVIGGGHTWPGGWAYAPHWLIGSTCRDINADQELWNFFRDKRL